MSSYDFEADDTAARRTGSLYVSAVGAYQGHISEAYLTEGKLTPEDEEKGLQPAKSLFIEGVIETGETFKAWLCYQNKDGKKNQGGDTNIQQLRACLGLDKLKAKEGMVVEVKDPDTNLMKKKRVVGFPDVIMKPIGFIFGPNLNTYQGKTSIQYQFDSFFDAETGLTAPELLAGETEPSAVQKAVIRLQAKEEKLRAKIGEINHVMKQAQSAPNAPVVDPFDMANDFDDDIPF